MEIHEMRSFMKRSSAKRASLRWSVLLSLGLLAACGHDATAPSATRSFYWQLQLNHHAVTLATIAPYDTIRLVATPLAQDGTPLTTTNRTVYTANDTSVTIDSTGLVRVHWAGSDSPTVMVIATLGVGDVQPLTLADTVFINVVDWSSAAAIPTLDSLLLRPVPGDSARRAIVNDSGVVSMQTLDPVIAKSTTGAVMPNVLVRYRSSDSLTAAFMATATTDVPQVMANKPGVALLTAEATVYGRRRVDSLWYTVGYPLRLLTQYGVGEFYAYPFTLPANYLGVGSLQVGLGGAVAWGNTTVGTTDNTLDIEFDRTTAIEGVPEGTAFPGFFGNITLQATAGGNIPAFAAAIPLVEGIQYVTTHIQLDSSCVRGRFFTQTGTYSWSSQHQPISGTVTVIPNDSLIAHSPAANRLVRSY